MITQSVTEQQQPTMRIQHPVIHQLAIHLLKSAIQLQNSDNQQLAIHLTLLTFSLLMYSFLFSALLEYTQKYMLILKKSCDHKARLENYCFTQSKTNLT